MKKALAIFSVFFVSVTTFASYSAISYSTTELEAANSLAEKWIINDHSGDTINYNLDDNVLRQEIAAVSRWVAWLDKKSQCDEIFDDLTAIDPNKWACINVEPLVDNDLITKNDTFRPEENITKAEAIGMLIKSIWFDYSYDSDNSDSWQVQIVDYAVEKWVVDDFTDYDIDATRGWVFMVADTTIKKDEEEQIEEEEEEDDIYTDEAF